MFTPIVVIVSLFFGALNFSKKNESYESYVEREVEQMRLESGDQDAVERYVSRERQSFDVMYENGRTISAFSNVPRQSEENLAKIGVR